MGRFSSTLVLSLAVASLIAVQAQIDGYADMSGTREDLVLAYASTFPVTNFAGTTASGPVTAPQVTAPQVVAVNGGGGGITVAADGSGNYKSVQAAVDAASPGATITIKAGTYTERVMITKKGLKVFGVGNPTISCNSAAKDYGGDTRKASCVAIMADDIKVTGVVFLNTYGWTDGKKGAQAPALLVWGDRVAFYNCKMIGHQDTLFALAGIQYYSGCFIEGTTDFIFGDAKALFEGCTLSAKNNDLNHKASLTAHYRQSKKSDTGYVFLKCTVTGNLQYKKRSPHQGRTWGPYARVVFAYCTYQIPIEPEGWALMKQSPKKYTKTAEFYEFANVNLDLTGRVSWSYKTLSAAQQSQFLGKQWIGGGSWL